MGLCFRRTVKLMPGVRINLSKSGVSTTVGNSAAHTTISSRRVTNTVDIPGSGLSYSETSAVRPAPCHPSVAYIDYVEQFNAAHAPGATARRGDRGKKYHKKR